MNNSVISEIQNHPPQTHTHDYQSTGPYLTNQTVQTEGMVSVNNSTGPISIVAGNNITLSQSLSVITIDAFNQSLQPAVQSINGSSGTISLNAGSNVTLSQSQNNITINVGGGEAGSNLIYSSASKNLTNISCSLTSNAISLSVGNYITTAMLSNQTSNLQYTSATSVITSVAMNTSERAALQYTSATSNITANAVNTSERVNYIYSSASKALTNISVTLGSNTISLSVGNYITTGALSNAVVLTNAGINTTNCSVTLSSNSVSFSVGNYITTGMLSGAGSNFLNTAPTMSLTNISVTISSANITLSVGNYITTAMLSANTSLFQYTSATSAITASAMNTNERGNYIYSSASKNLTNITVTLGSSAISLSVGNYITTAMQSGANTSFVNASASTAGTNISMTIASNGLSISCNDVGAAAEHNNMEIAGNTVGQSTFSGSTIRFIGGDSITLSGVNASQIRIDAAGGGGAVQTYYSYQNRQYGASLSSSAGLNTLWLAPFRLGNPISASSIALAMSYSGTITSAATAQHGETIELAIYSQNPSSSTRFDTLWKGALSVTVWNSGTSSVSFNIGGTTSSSNASNLMITYFMGLRMFTLPIGSIIPAGLYMFGSRFSSSTAGYSAHMSRIAAIFDNPLASTMGYMGLASDASVGVVDAGKYSVTSAGFPNTIGLSEISIVSNMVPVFRIGAI